MCGWTGYRREYQVGTWTQIRPNTIIANHKQFRLRLHLALHYFFCKNIVFFGRGWIFLLFCLCYLENILRLKNSFLLRLKNSVAVFKAVLFYNLVFRLVFTQSTVWLLHNFVSTLSPRWSSLVSEVAKKRRAPHYTRTLSGDSLK